VAEEIASGAARKMHTELADPVQYRLPLGEAVVSMNPLLGRQLQLRYAGAMHCIHCGRKSSKSFNQGYCYPCFRRLAQCDSCIVSPEKCHFDQGTCREPDWAQQHCMTDHFVYLSNTSGLKVGITRGSQVPTRWIDQGATQARPIFRVSSRYISGLVEVLFKPHIADRTNWQAMLKGDADDRDLEQARQELLAVCAADIEALQQEHGLQALSVLEDQVDTRIRYPVLQHPGKVKSFNLDKQPLVEGTLQGIKGQYLIFDTGVINIRKYGGYELSLTVTD
jgi:hypothetical protein